MSWSHSRSSQTSSFVYQTQSSASLCRALGGGTGWPEKNQHQIVMRLQRAPAAGACGNHSKGTSLLFWWLGVCSPPAAPGKKRVLRRHCVYIGHSLGVRRCLPGFGQANSNPELMSLTWEFLGREVNFFRDSTCTSCFCHFKGKC